MPPGREDSMKLYEKRNEVGRIVEWWTQRNKMGIYFSIKPNGKAYTVTLNDDFNYAKCENFLDAERKLREAESKYADKYY